MGTRSKTTDSIYATVRGHVRFNAEQVEDDRYLLHPDNRQRYNRRARRAAFARLRSACRWVLRRVPVERRTVDQNALVAALLYRV